MVHVTLVCAVVGVREGVFSLKIDTKGWEDQLKDAIKAAKPALIPCEARTLRLFLAKRAGSDVWLTKEEVQQDGFDTRELRSLSDAAVPLSWNGLSEQEVGTQIKGEGEIAFHSPVHVLAVLPSALSSMLSVPLDVGGVTINVTKHMVVNDPPLIAYWKALAATSTEVVAGTVVTLPKGIYLLGDPALGSHIYVRRCFPELWMSFYGSDEGVGILGTSGIGKTYVGYFFLLCLALRGKTVVYERAGAHECILFSGNVAVRGPREDFSDVLLKPDTCYVVDDVEPKHCPAKTMFASSSHLQVRALSSRLGCKMPNIPLWSKLETSRCRELMFSNTSVAMVEMNYHSFGGPPRFIPLQKAVCGSATPDRSSCEHGRASMDSPASKRRRGDIDPLATSVTSNDGEKGEQVVLDNATFREEKALVQDEQERSKNETSQEEEASVQDEQDPTTRDAIQEEEVLVPDEQRTIPKIGKAEMANAQQRTEKLERVKRIYKCCRLMEEAFITEGASNSVVKEVIKQLAAKYGLQVIPTYLTTGALISTGSRSTEKSSDNRRPSSTKQRGQQPVTAAWRTDPVTTQLLREREEVVGKLKSLPRDSSKMDGLQKQLGGYNLRIKARKIEVRAAQNN
ncbi:unnamed protein product [Hyaloperonospora brassicae]|uniref:Crinkler effector protein N-terminal domain-containing protein n=1 Tax=Hyaloperonospora brassicae TaxID=162125 RepID=A0AAV0U0C9_HYABA|nr:unnamed protein product [Hyaloperonospora brassicae]